MEFTIKELDGSAKTIMPLAEAYMRSYNELSQKYKSDKEMALYKKGTFIKKLKKFSQDKSSSVFVLYAEDNPCGFIRYSDIPSHYKVTENNKTQELEKGNMDGYEFAWNRKVAFVEEAKLDDRTMIINQIYLDPKIQNQGLGTQILKHTLPLMAEKYDTFIIEYNSNNLRAKKFYGDVLGLEPIARTQDFDHIVQNERGKAEFCLSGVEIGMSSIGVAMGHINALETKNAPNQKLLNSQLRGKTNAR